MQRVQNALGGQFDALRRGVGRAGQRGCYRQLVWATIRSRRRTTSVVSSFDVTGRREQASQLLPRVHLAISLLKRWMLGTHQGAVSHEHLDYYLDEFVFRFNRRRLTQSGQALLPPCAAGQWRWSRRRTARSSPTGTLRRCEPNYKMLGSPESSGYPIKIKWGIHLTQVTPRCSMRLRGGLSTRPARVRGTLRQRRGLSRLSVRVALAGGFPLSGMRA